MVPFLLSVVSSHLLLLALCTCQMHATILSYLQQSPSIPVPLVSLLQPLSTTLLLPFVHKFFLFLLICKSSSGVIEMTTLVYLAGKYTANCDVCSGQRRLVGLYPLSVGCSLRVSSWLEQLILGYTYLRECSSAWCSSDPKAVTSQESWFLVYAVVVKFGYCNVTFRSPA